MNWLILVTTLIFAAQTQAASQIKVGGGAAPVNNIFRKIQAPFEKASGMQLQISEDGPDMAIRDLDEGKLTVATAGLGEKDWLQLAEEKKITLKHKNDLKFRVIGKDLIVIVAHAGTKAKELSKEQLKALFTGATKNWKSITGVDQGVVIISGEKIPGTNKFFKKTILEGAEFAADALTTGTAPEVLAKVKDTPGAIGLLPMGLNAAGAIEPKIPEIGRPITAATLGVPSAEVQQLFKFIAEEGPKYMK